jgi:hypothetical protein
LSSGLDVRPLPVASVLAAVLAAFLLAPPGLSAAREPPGTKPAKIALDAKVVARARQMTVTLQDVPDGWFAYPLAQPGLVNKLGPALACGGHVADFSRLVFRGGWSSRLGFRHGLSRMGLISAVTVFSTVDQAAVAFAHSAYWADHYCAHKGMRDGRYVFVSVRRVSLPPLADQRADIRSLRVAKTGTDRQIGQDFILLRRGPVVALLQVLWVHREISRRTEDMIAQRFARRLHL